MDTSDIRSVNVKSILDTLRFTSGLTKKELSEKTGLSFSTVSNTCNKLQESGVLSQQRQPTAGAGRFPKKIILNGVQFCTVCIFLQAVDAITVSVLSLNNGLLFNATCDISACANIEEILDYAYRCFRSFNSGRSENVTYIGLAIAVPGIYDEHRSLLINPIPILDRTPIKTIAEKKFGLPCYINSASNYCAIEMQRTVTQADNFIYLHLAEEITAGIICQRQLVTGQHGHAPRIGHLPLGDLSRPCPVTLCGGYGCLETEISLYGMVENYQRDISTAALHALWREQVQKVKSDVEGYRTYLEEKGGYIGSLLSVLVSLFDPAMIVIGGDCVKLGNELSPIAERRLSRLCPLACEEGLQIRWDDESETTLYQGMVQVAYESWTPNI